MIITITKRQAEQIGVDSFKEWGFDRKTFYWGDSKGIIHIKTLSEESLVRLETLLTKHENVYGVKTHLRDLTTWHMALDTIDEGKIKVASVKAFEMLLTAFMLKVPGQRVYCPHTEGDGGYHAYHLDGIEYHPPVHHKATRDNPAWTTPDYVDYDLHYETYEGKASTSHSYHKEDVRGKTIAEILTHDDVFPETPELRADYLKETERFQKIFLAIGRQYIANGSAVDLTVNNDDDDNNRWWRRSRSQAIVELPLNSRVVVDVTSESKDGAALASNNHKTNNTCTVKGFWKTTKKDLIFDEDDDTEPESKEEAKIDPVEIPIHPYLVVFHLSKHMRLRVHAVQLNRYKYDTKLIDKLVIDDTRKALVKMLIRYRDSKYADVIGSKSGGAIVMLCGAPGTGKTLTAEVFAEHEKRALYSVQCAQLGVTPEALETELLKVLTRAARWNAVLLLDEADVYVHKRGTDIQQNALVGVFLRVLEYTDALMFMTTNRAKDIDDAIASRCTARLTYQVPTFDEQVKIWRVLSATAEVEMGDEAIRAVAKKHSELSGRDVKNLIKLAMLVSKDKPITEEMIDFVKQFKPT